tara:strand:- start:159 stop:395 length:237 start_codon:yes stop_codon:yes gene_type:complete
VLSFIKGIGLKTWGYIAVFFAALGFIYKVYDAGGDKVENGYIKQTLEKQKEGRDAVVKEQKDVTGLSNSDIVERMRRR